MTVTKLSVQDQQGSESAYSDPKTKPKYVEKYTKYKQWEVTIRKYNCTIKTTSNWNMGKLHQITRKVNFM